jgi:macrodomain Ter protein organizer (MatP/YcbG family)
MNNTRVKISDADFGHVVAYLKLKMAAHIEWFRLEHKEDRKAARRAFQDAVESGSCGKLRDFCSAWLTPEQWRQLSSALRSRKSKRALDKKTLNVTHEAYSLLKMRSTETGKTLSDTIIHMFSEAGKNGGVASPKTGGAYGGKDWRNGNLSRKAGLEKNRPPLVGGLGRQH